MFDNCCIFLNATTSKAPVVVQGTHEQLGRYVVTVDPVWVVRNIDGEASVDGQRFKGIKVGTVGLTGTVTFGDGSTLTTPEIILPVRHLVPSAIEIIPRPKATA